MATGIVTSQQLQPAPLPAGTTLRSGEVAPQAGLALLKDKNARTFHHMVPGAKFIMPDGLEVQFLGGQFVTNDPAIIAELSKIADKASSMIFTKKEVAENIKELQLGAAKDAVQTPKAPE